MQAQQLDLNLIDRLHRKEHILQLQVLIRHQEQLNRQQLKHEPMQVYYHHFHLGLEIQNKTSRPRDMGHVTWSINGVITVDRYELETDFHWKL